MKQFFKRVIKNLHAMLNRGNEIINSIAKGMIYGNMVNSIGGGVVIEEALR